MNWGETLVKGTNKRTAFLLFATAMLFSMVREWSAPVACVRETLTPSIAATLPR
jgi:hypothetical protein